MAKDSVRFDTVHDFNDTQIIFERSKERLASNLRYFEKRYGDKGGAEKLPDGIMSLTGKEPNGKDSPSYKAMLEELESLILAGELYHMSKDKAASFMLSLRSKHTKPQMASQKIEASLFPASKRNESVGMVKTLD